MKTALKPDLASTRYDTAKCDIGVVHIGFGAFHRAHQAVYLDDVMDITGDLRWGVAAVNLRAAEAGAFAAHQGAKSGYVLKSVSPEGEVAFRIVRAHIAFEDWSAAPKKAEALLARAGVHIVTITVTESGYYLDNSGALNAHDPVISSEISGAQFTSVYAYLSAALRKRMKSINQPITILCCDNIRQNGKMLRANLLAYLALTGQGDLARWVEENATFPCSMVDRITPRSTQDMRAEVEALYGPSPASPIMAESFVQWVLEDNFAGPRPQLEKAGVTLTSDVDPYEEAKIRILNGGHTCLAYLAALSGLKTFDQAMAAPALYDHFWRYETEEVLPALTLDLPFDKTAYLTSIAKRFGNASIADSVERICADGAAKFPIFVRPTLEGCLSQGKIPQFGLRSVASWYIFCRHSKAGSLPLNYLEPSWNILAPMLASENLDKFVNSELLWGDLPDRFPEFVDTLHLEITEMDRKWPV